MKDLAYDPSIMDLRIQDGDFYILPDENISLQNANIMLSSDIINISNITFGIDQERILGSFSMSQFANIWSEQVRSDGATIANYDISNVKEFTIVNVTYPLNPQ